MAASPKLTRAAAAKMVANLQERYDDGSRKGPVEWKRLFIACGSKRKGMLLAKQIVEDSVPDAEAYVMTLEERFRESASKLFLEIAEDDDDDLEEVAEAVDLTVHSNAFRFGSQVPSQNGDALGGKIQGARLVV